ncbi:hypothetical protein ETW23_04710 [Leisingera sp. NJS201]|nr:hypothetical protein ETW23_04710 [Leisingera sp. NJS201]
MGIALSGPHGPERARRADARRRAQSRQAVRRSRADAAAGDLGNARTGQPAFSTAPGFMMPLGSSACLIARMAASLTGSP